ncbi:MAG: glycosyltransferase [Rubricoccaceae bacterium]|nr:glycosyltransferase [Rubricoccaceae bacterium]
MKDSSEPRLLFAFLGDVRQSSRALRQLVALREAGFQLEIYTLGPAPQNSNFADSLTVGPDIQVHVIDSRFESGPRMFLDVHKKLLKATQKSDADVYMASDLFVLPALAVHAGRKKARLVFDSRELYSHLDSHRSRPLVRAFWRFVERRYIKETDLVLTVNQSIAEQLAHLYRIRPPVVVRNIPPSQQIPTTKRLRERLGIDTITRIALYQGGLRRGRGIEVLIRAARQIPEAAFVVVGSGPLLNELRHLSSDASNVHFIPHIAPFELLSFTASADLGIHLMEDTCLNHRLALPNKIFEYLMAGLPVVASDLPEIAKVVKGFDTGLVVDPTNPNSVVEAIRTALFDDSARKTWTNNIPSVFEEYSWENDRELFLQRIRGILHDKH